MRSTPFSRYTEATLEIDRQSVGFKNELLFQHGINFNDLPSWQRRGTGLYWEQYAKVGYNPIQDQEVTAIRRRLKIDEELPMKETYRGLVAQILETGYL